MKRIFLLFVFLTTILAGFAQDDVFVVDTQDSIVPPSFVESEETLSKLFSKTFCLPDYFLMNQFNCQLSGNVSAKGELQVNDINFFDSPITCRGTKDMTDSLKLAVRDWFIHANIALVPGSKNGQTEDGMPVHFTIRYLPLFFAQTGDTLFCSVERIQHAGAQGEEAVGFYNLYVRNSKNSESYAKVRRSQNDLTLHCFDTLNKQPFLVQKYVINAPDKIVKKGFQQYLKDGKVHYRQFYESDYMRYAEEFDNTNQLYAKYFIEYRANNSYPQLSKKETYYPSGKLQLSTSYFKDQTVITAYNEDGSKATFTPAKNANKGITKYFKKHFRAPSTHGLAADVNYFILNLDLMLRINEQGQITIQTSDAKWSYNYAKNLASLAFNQRISQAIREYYTPYLDTVLKDLAEQNFQCTPAKINNQPVSSTFLVHIEHEFIPR